VPNHIVNKLARARKYMIQKGISYYQKLADREAKGPRNIFSDKNITAFCPYASSYNYEAWLVPKRRVDNITELKDDELKSLAKALKKILNKVNELQLPYNFYMHQTLTDNHEYYYMRVCPRRDTWAGVELGSRVIVNTVPPEEAAKFYRGK
jgi:UDPglucose--hexose-1-phosphate uridylyltransferase